MKKLTFFDKITTPESWKKAALDNAFADKPKLKKWQFGTVIAVTAVMAALMIAVPAMSMKYNKVPEVKTTPAARDSVTDREKKSGTINALAAMEKDYDYVIRGTIIDSSPTSAAIKVLVDQKDFEKYHDLLYGEGVNGSWMTYMNVDLDPMGYDYTGGEKKSGLGGSTDKDEGDLVALGFKILPQEDGVYRPTFKMCQGYANLGESDNDYFERLNESVRIMNLVDPNGYLADVSSIMERTYEDMTADIEDNNSSDYDIEMLTPAGRYNDVMESYMGTGYSYEYIVKITPKDGGDIGSWDMQLRGFNAYETEYAKGGELKNAVMTLTDRGDTFKITPSFSDRHITFYSAHAGEVDGSLYVVLDVIPASFNSAYGSGTVVDITTETGTSSYNARYEYYYGDDKEKFTDIPLITNVTANDQSFTVEPEALLRQYEIEPHNYLYHLDLLIDMHTDDPIMSSTSGGYDQNMLIDLYVQPDMADGEKRESLLLCIAGAGDPENDCYVDAATRYLPFEKKLLLTISYESRDDIVRLPKLYFAKGYIGDGSRGENVYVLKDGYFEDTEKFYDPINAADFDGTTLDGCVIEYLPANRNGTDIDIKTMPYTDNDTDESFEVHEAEKYNGSDYALLDKD